MDTQMDRWTDGEICATVRVSLACASPANRLRDRQTHRQTDTSNSRPRDQSTNHSNDLK